MSNPRISEIVPSRRDFAQFLGSQRAQLVPIPRLGGDAGLGRNAMVAFAKACDDAEAAALAVITGEKAESLDDLAAVAAAVGAPILRDALLVDPQQVYDARLHGADAVILPAGIDAQRRAEMADIAGSLHMACLIEVRRAADAGACLQHPRIIAGLRCEEQPGVVDIAATRAIASAIPPRHIVVCLAEVRSQSQLTALQGHCDAVLVDEWLRRYDSVAEALAAIAPT